MDKTTLAMLGDEELTAVSGGRRVRKMPPGFVKNIAQSNTADIDVFAPGNKGELTVYVEQSNTAS